MTLNEAVVPAEIELRPKQTQYIKTLAEPLEAFQKQVQAKLQELQSAFLSGAQFIASDLGLEDGIQFRFNPEFTKIIPVITAPEPAITVDAVETKVEDAVAAA